MYKLNVEYREMAVLRLRLLKDLPNNNGVIPVNTFQNLFRCIIKNGTNELERKFIDVIKLDNENVSYYKICNLINKFQYYQVYIK